MRNPVVPLPTLQDKLQSSVFFQLKDVRSAAGAVGLDGHWATLGVVCQRAQPRESDGGSVYSIAKVRERCCVCGVCLFLVCVCFVCWCV